MMFTEPVAVLHAVVLVDLLASTTAVRNRTPNKSAVDACHATPGQQLHLVDGRYKCVTCPDVCAPRNRTVAQPCRYDEGAGYVDMQCGKCMPGTCNNHTNLTEPEVFKTTCVSCPAAATSTGTTTAGTTSPTSPDLGNVSLTFQDDLEHLPLTQASPGGKASIIVPCMLAVLAVIVIIATVVVIVTKCRGKTNDTNKSWNPCCTTDDMPLDDGDIGMPLNDGDIAIPLNAGDIDVSLNLVHGDDQPHAPEPVVHDDSPFGSWSESLHPPEVVIDNDPAVDGSGHSLEH